jgi:hypothetical protein
MPLDLAVFQIFRRVYQDRLHVAAPGRSTAHLDGLAYVIAEYTPIYTYAPHGGSARALTKAELAGGLFQDGAKALIYIDGRPTVEHLAVSAKTVPAVTVTLIAASNVRDPHG